MADRIQIHTGRLGTDAQRILVLIQNMKKDIDAMRQSVTALENMWEGPGQAEFHQAWQDDITAVLAAVKEMESMYDYDINAKNQYEQCEKKIAAMIEEIKV